LLLILNAVKYQNCVIIDCVIKLNLLWRHNLWCIVVYGSAWSVHIE